MRRLEGRAQLFCDCCRHGTDGDVVRHFDETSDSNLKANQSLQMSFSSYYALSPGLRNLEEFLARPKLASKIETIFLT